MRLKQNQSQIDICQSEYVSVIGANLSHMMYIFDSIWAIPSILWNFHSKNLIEFQPKYLEKISFQTLKALNGSIVGIINKSYKVETVHSATNSSGMTEYFVHSSTFVMGKRSLGFFGIFLQRIKQFLKKLNAQFTIWKWSTIFPNHSMHEINFFWTKYYNDDGIKFI